MDHRDEQIIVLKCFRISAKYVFLDLISHICPYYTEMGTILRDFCTELHPLAQQDTQLFGLNFTAKHGDNVLQGNESLQSTNIAYAPGASITNRE